jgi:FkbM family methyltransferase
MRSVVSAALLLVFVVCDRPHLPTDRRRMQSFDRCTFQSIRDDPVDQFVFALFGGQFAEWSRDFLGPACDMWSAPHREVNCPCSAPANLLGPSHTYVEIGANDGVHMSNTWFFDQFLGWSGLCVEANPVVYQRLTRNRPNCTNVNSLVSMNATTVPFISFYRDGEKADPARDWETGLSGVEGSEFAGNHEISSLERARQFAARTPGLKVRRDVLPVTPFARLFELHGLTSVDFLSLDVEGHELEVLQSIDFDRVHIRVIVTESSGPAVARLLSSHGFRRLPVSFRLGDSVFVRGREPGRRASPRRPPRGAI